MAGISSAAITNAAQNAYKANGGTELGSGEWTDGSGLELYETSYRSYDAQIGRFMQVDPLMESTANFGGYTFVNDNPVMAVDPLGLLLQKQEPGHPGQGSGDNPDDIWGPGGQGPDGGGGGDDDNYPDDPNGLWKWPVGGGVGGSSSGSVITSDGEWWSFVDQMGGYNDGFEQGVGGSFGTNGSVQFHGSGNGGDPGPGDPKKKKNEKSLSWRKGWKSLTGISWNNVLNTETAAHMTLDWYLGWGDNNITFTNDRVTDALRKSPGIIEARENYYNIHKISGHYDFGLLGLFQAGFDPILQFVGSFNYKIDLVGNNLQYTITNQTSFASASYHLWPYSWNWKEGPMSNFTQTYIFTEPIIK